MYAGKRGSLLGSARLPATISDSVPKLQTTHHRSQCVLSQRITIFEPITIIT